MTYSSSRNRIRRVYILLSNVSIARIFSEYLEEKVIPNRLMIVDICRPLIVKKGGEIKIYSALLSNYYVVFP